MEEIKRLFNEVYQEIKNGCHRKKFSINLNNEGVIVYSELSIDEGVEGWKTLEEFKGYDYEKLLTVYSHYLKNVMDMKQFFINKRVEYLNDKFKKVE